MTRIPAICAVSIIAAAAAVAAQPVTVEEQLTAADAAFRGQVLQTRAFVDPRDGFVYTRARIRVDEVFKGKPGVYVVLTHRGGVAEGMGEWNSQTPRLREGDRAVLFVANKQGRLAAVYGADSVLPLGPDRPAGESALPVLRARAAAGALPGADLTEVDAAELGDGGSQLSPPPMGFSGATNLMTGSDGLPARFLQPDRGQGIPYLIDLDALPLGMTQSQAVYAVTTALAAWTNVSSVRFIFGGIQSFGTAAPNISASDGVLRIQLHDLYNYVTGGNELGVGGLAWSIPQPPSTGWTGGGNVAGNDFHRAVRSYIVLESSATSMRNLSTFTEVLTHEIGHTLGLGHSSENQFETSTLLKQAVMYYLVHADGRGAALNNFDINVCRQVHPFNTPPWTYDRVMDIVTAPGAFSTPWVNQIELRGYDLQGTALTLDTTDPSFLNGSFSVTGQNLLYTPNGYFGATSRLDPAGTQYREIIYARFSDGVNASPAVKTRVLSYSPDAYSEGIPDAWRTTYFGSANPNSGPNRHATQDFEGDGFNNVTEYRLGSDPTSKSSNLRITSVTTTNIQWQAKGYELYEVLGSTNLVNWTRTVPPVVPTTSTGSASLPAGVAGQFFRVLKVP